MNGMVLSAMPMGEYDKRLTILTVERGKISVFARGARKPTSSLLACSQPFTFGEFTTYAGRNSYTVTNAQVANYFQGMRDDLTKMYLGMYFCEFADYYTREGNDEREVLKLLYQSLRALESGKYDARLVRRIFELKMISLEGEAPLVQECVCCGAKENLTHFFMRRDGVVCADCAGADLKYPKAEAVAANPFQQFPSMYQLSPSALYAMQYIVQTPSTKLFNFTLKDEALAELADVVEHYIKKHVNHEMKSLAVMEAMGM